MKLWTRTNQPKKRKKGEKDDKDKVVEKAPKPIKQKIPYSTERQYDMDRNKSLHNFHSSTFQAVLKAVQHTRKPIKVKKEVPHSSHQEILNKLLPQTGPNGDVTPLTPTQLSDRRLAKEKEKKEAKAQAKSQLSKNAQGQYVKPGTTSAQSGQPAAKGSDRLASYAMSHFKTQDAQRAVVQIYRNSALSEETKVKQLTDLIHSYKQQLITLSQQQQQKSQLAKSQMQPPGAMRNQAFPVQAAIQQQLAVGSPQPMTGQPQTIGVRSPTSLTPNQKIAIARSPASNKPLVASPAQIQSHHLQQTARAGKTNQPTPQLGFAAGNLQGQSVAQAIATFPASGVVHTQVSAASQPTPGQPTSKGTQAFRQTGTRK